MRIDSQHPGYLSGEVRQPTGVGLPAEYDPRLPEVAPEVPLLVNDDFIDAWAVRGPGMAPFFGVDGLEELPGIQSGHRSEYSVGVDGLAEAHGPMAALGPEIDGVNPPGQAFARALITEPIGFDMDQILAPFSRRPVAGPESFHPDDAMEPRFGVRGAGLPPQSGDDGLQIDPPGFDVRAPVVGSDGVEPTVSYRRPAPDPQFVNDGDGIDVLRRGRLRALVN
jgi:hypothetical protein